MKKYRTAGFAFFSAGMLLLSSGTVFAAAEGDVSAAESNEVSNTAVYDGADLLTDSEEDGLNQTISELEQTTGWEIFVVTTDDAEGKTTQSYNESFLNDHLSGDDGVSYIVDIDNGELYLSTTGAPVIACLTDSRIDTVIDDGYTDAKNGDYAASFEAMLNQTNQLYQDDQPKPKTIKWYEALIALGIALAAGGITFVSVVGKYRLKWGTYKYDFHANGKTDIIRKEDHFVNQIVTHHHIERNPSGGGKGGSTVHTGAGGRSYGGGGRKL